MKFLRNPTEFLAISLPTTQPSTERWEQLLPKDEQSPTRGTSTGDCEIMSQVNVKGSISFFFLALT